LVAEHETAAAELQSMIEKLAFDKLQIEAARDEVCIGKRYAYCLSFCLGLFAIVSSGQAFLILLLLFRNPSVY
jgi:hypothetical protein